MGRGKTTTYVSKAVDKDGNADYTDEENQVWKTLYERQWPIVKNRACDEYIEGLKLLNLAPDRIPQCPEVNKVLQDTTGWSLEPVSALIPIQKFFDLLAERKFPAATFIRRVEELDYLEEPDIFHEVFGHGPLLTNKALADFTWAYGKLGKNATPQERTMLARLYWFTVEFGLIKTEKGPRIYGGGILSSMKETPYCLESDIPQRKPFDIVDMLRTPYLINILQPIYFMINSFDDLFELTQIDLMALVRQAMEMGMHEPAYKK